MKSEYPTYSIYHYHVKWVMDETPDFCRAKLEPGWKASWEGLPEGRIRNSYSGKKMFREDPGLDGVRAIVGQNWEAYGKKGGNPSEPEITIKLIEHEEWCLGWFDHYTFDVGQLDAEALASFERFLERKGVQVSHCYDPYEVRNYDGYCAMGAEDRWRWSGLAADGKERIDPPCRCDGCKKNGIIKIIH